MTTAGSTAVPRILLRKANGFPVTLEDTVEPTDPADEKPRSYWNEHPENLAQRMERTRRYFRLMNRRRGAKIAEDVWFHFEAR